jgi:hypothetical protein
MDEWVVRDELFGVRPGMNKNEAIAMLAKYGVMDVLPGPKHEINITNENIDRLEQFNVTGICINDYKNAASMKVRFDSDGRVIEFINGENQEFIGLVTTETRADFISELRFFITQHGGLEIFSCLPERSWVRINNISVADKEFLLRYDSWCFDEPGGYSNANLRFESGVISKISYRKRLSEPW